MIKLVVLGSGSKGNSTYVDIDGHKYLIDCGFTKIAIKKRLATIGKTIEEIEGVVVTHDHKDHTSPWLIKDGMIISDLSNTPFKPFQLSHDAPCTGYTFQDQAGNKVGFVADTGCIPEDAIGHLFDCAVIIVETNYDIDMLAVGKYPVELLERIASEDGHLRNECAAELIEMVAWPGLQCVIGMHLSGSNNHPDLARFCLQTAIEKAGAGEFCVEVIISDQKTPTKMMALL